MNFLYKVFLLSISIFLFSKCDLEDPLEPLPMSEVFSLEYDKNAVLYANGQDQIALKVRLKYASKDPITIVFETEEGSFVNANASNPKIKSVTTTTEAIVFFKTSDTPRENVKVTISVAGFSETILFNFLPVENYLLLSTTTGATSFPADGEEITLIATINEKVRLYQNIEFVTEEGIFIEDGDLNKTITKTIIERSIKVILTSPKDPVDDVIITAKIGAYSAILSIDFKPLKVDDFIDLEVIGNASILADNFSKTELRVNLGPKYDRKQKLILSIEQGSFINSFGQAPTNNGKTIELEELSDNVHIFLQADQTPNSNVNVIATYKGYSDIIKLTFLPAYPLIGSLNRNKYKVKTNGDDAVQLTAKFLRESNSKVSNNVPVTFKVKPVEGSTAIGRLTEQIVFLSNQEAKTSLVSENGKPGKVIVQAYIANSPFNDILEIEVEFIE